MDQLQGKIAVVTGAGRGIGRCAALRLAGRGLRVALVARSAAQLSETADAIAGGAARRSRCPPTWPTRHRCRR